MLWLTALILLCHVLASSCYPQTYLNASMMPRADTLPRENTQGPSDIRGLKISPQYLFRAESDSSNSDWPQYPDDIVQLVQKLVSDASDFFKKALKLSQPVRKEGILLSRSCEYASGTGVIYASLDPILSACPERCGAKTFCGPRIEVQPHMLTDCVEQYYVDQVLYLDPYDANPNEDPAPIDADYILFVEMQRTDTTMNSVVADNAFCQQDLTTYRPIAGYLLFDQSQLQYSGRSYERMLAEVKHSVAHVLGFSLNALGLSPTLNNYAYERYPDINEERLPWDNLQKHSPEVFFPTPEILRNISTPRGNKYLLSSPKVITVAREYFNCTSLTSVEMENFMEEDETIPGSHWEEKLFPQELMSMTMRTADANPDLSFSKFSLALFEDTGWFVADYSAAEPMTFGQNAGCSFLEDRSCIESIEKFPSLYCDGSFQQTCYDHTSEVSCEKFIMASHYSSTKNLDENAYTDYCPIMGPAKTSCSIKLADRLSSFPSDDDVITRCVRLKSETNQTPTCLYPKSEYGLCDVITCNPNFYYVTELGLNCTYDNEIVKTEIEGSCKVQLTCPPCSEVCSDCSQFPKERPVTPTAISAASLVKTTFSPISSIFFTILILFV